MEQQPVNNNPKYCAIPEQFHSFATGEPFKNCIICKKDLLKKGIQYLIEKAIIKYPNSTATDVAFEYAMCLSCTQNMRQQLSKDSITEIDNFFSQRTNLASRQAALLQKKDVQLDDWLGTCIVRNKAVHELTEYQIYAHCEGENMLLGYAPYLLSGEALAEIQELISPQTKDILDDFIDNYFGLPPELSDLVKERNLLLI